MMNSVVFMIQLASLFLLAGFGPSEVQSANVNVAWGFNINDAQLSAGRSDFLVFNYQPIHTVFIMPSLVALQQCDFSGATEVCGTSDSPCSVDLSHFAAQQRAWFACSFHCVSNNMRLTVTLGNATKEYEYEYEEYEIPPEYEPTF